MPHIFSCGKQLFSTLTKQKRTVFRTWPISSKELAQTNAKGAFCRAGPCRLCIHHRDTFVYFYQAAFPGFCLRMDKGIIANFSGAFIKFVMICMVHVIKCLPRQRPAMPARLSGIGAPMFILRREPQTPPRPSPRGRLGFCVSQSERGIRRCRCLPSA